MSLPTVNWLGLDVAKESVQAALLSEDGTVKNISVPRTEEGALALIAWTNAFSKDQPVRAVMEATGRYSQELAVWLDCLRPAIINPELIYSYGKSLGLRNKTDALDALAIAQYGAERKPLRTEHLSEEHLALREYVRTRQDLIKLRTAQKNRTSENLVIPQVRAVHQAVIDVLNTQIAAMEGEMRRVCEEDEKLSRDLALLVSVPGIGETTAMVLLGELGDLRRFKSGRAIAAFVGLSPRLHQSGTSVNKPARLCKKGNSQVRSSLYMASICAAKGGHAYSEMYKRFVKNGKAKRQALCAVARKTLVLCRAVLVNNNPYDLNYKKTPLNA